MFKLKKFGIGSVAKMLGVLYAIIGLIVGLIFSLVALLAASFGGTQTGAIGLIFGVGAIVFFPIIYGIIGLVAGAITALIYNFLAARIGGIEIELVE